VTVAVGVGADVREGVGVGPTGAPDERQPPATKRRTISGTANRKMPDEAFTVVC
jgi:hypothetical protein